MKFAINLTALGFSMDDDDFSIEVASGKTSVIGYKKKDQQPTTDLNVVIFREPPLSDSSDSSDSDTEEGTWYAIVDTTTLAIGEMRVIARAFVPDPNANDYVRTEIAIAPLGTLEKP